MRRLADLELLTPRLRLRPVVAADAPTLFEIFSDPEVMRYWSTPPWTSAGQAEEMVRQEAAAAAAGSSVRLAVLVRPGAAAGPGGAGPGGAGPGDAGPGDASPVGELIGTVSLFAVDLGNRRAEIGYALRRSAWGHGYATEAVRAVVDHALEALDLNRLEADIDPRNDASARLLGRLGFRREGLLRERWIVAGEVSDSALYGLLRSDRP